MVMYVVVYVLNKNGIEPIHINPTEYKKDHLLHLINSYENLVRVAIEFIIGGRSFFTYNLSDVKNIEYINFFRSYGVGTTTHNPPTFSVGFIDSKKGVRVEYMQDGIRVYQMK